MEVEAGPRLDLKAGPGRRKRDRDAGMRSLMERGGPGGGTGTSEAEAGRRCRMRASGGPPGGGDLRQGLWWPYPSAAPDKNWCKDPILTPSSIHSQ